MSHRRTALTALVLTTTAALAATPALAAPAQIALAWTLSVAPNVLLIPGTSSVAHLEDNVAAAGVTLADDKLIAPALGVPVGDPVLMLERLEWLNNMPVSHYRRYFPPDHRFEGEV